jgi:hypothetical protein
MKSVEVFKAPLALFYNVGFLYSILDVCEEILFEVITQAYILPLQNMDICWNILPIQDKSAAMKHRP